VHVTAAEPCISSHGGIIEYSGGYSGIKVTDIVSQSGEQVAVRISSTV